MRASSPIRAKLCPDCQKPAAACDDHWSPAAFGLSRPWAGCPSIPAPELSQEDRILIAIRSASAGQEKISWDQIIAAIKAAGISIPEGGWMRVRGVLQYAIDQGMLMRTPDVKNEEFLTSLEGKVVYWEEMECLNSGVVVFQNGPRLVISHSSKIVHKKIRQIRLYSKIEDVIA